MFFAFCLDICHKGQILFRFHQPIPILVINSNRLVCISNASCGGHHLFYRNDKKNKKYLQKTKIADFDRFFEILQIRHESHNNRLFNSCPA